MNTDFLNFLKEINFDKDQTRIEKYRLDGTSNYLISLNNSGITWAISLRIPAMGIEYSEFENEKKIAVRTADFMSKHLSKRVNVAENVCFLFDGRSNLVSYNSVIDFFNYQNSLLPLVEIDEVTGNVKEKIIKCEPYPTGIDRVENIDETAKERIKKYFSDYKGNFFASKGAPASETLDNHFELVLEAVRSLAVLHAKTGLKELIPIEVANSKARLYDNMLNELSEKPVINPDTPSYKSFEKYQKKWNKQNIPEITRLVCKEIFIRTKSEKKYLLELINQFEDKIKSNRNYYCFTHNDPHSENFIIVEYLYNLVQENHQYIDREFINKIFRSIPEYDAVEKISIDYIKEENKLLYRKFNNADMGKSNTNIVKRSLSYDIHLIDIDDATGIEPENQRLYLYDLFIFTASVVNLGMIKNKKIETENVVSAYYDFFSKINGEKN
jgi:hypothetical protein